MKHINFFSIKRFCNLLCYDLLIHKKTYLLSVLGGFFAVFFLFVLDMPGKSAIYGSNQYHTMFITSFLGFLIFIGTAFPDLSGKVKSGNYLLLPASTFEKILHQFLFRVVLGIIVFLFVFWLSSHLGRLVANQSSRVLSLETTIEPFHFSMLFEERGIFMDKIILFIFICICLFLFTTRLFFHRLAIIKSVIAATILIIIFSTVMIVISHIFFPAEAHGISTYYPRYKCTIDYLSNFHTSELLAYYLCSILSISLLVLAYYKLKEKQVL